VKDLDGKAVNLGDYLGRQPVLLEFWATWCEVCEGLLPTVQAAHRAYGDRVAFFGVNVTVNQTPERVRKYVDTRHPPFRTLYDAEGEAVRAYAAPTTSYIVIVDRTGKVSYTGTGASQDLAAALHAVASP
jgi:thiol-disulfide isomerase/thioredoxin